MQLVDRLSSLPPFFLASSGEVPDATNEEFKDEELSFDDFIKSEDEDQTDEVGTLSIIEDDFDDEADAEEDADDYEHDEEEFEVIADEHASQRDEKRIAVATSESRKFQGPPKLLNNVLQNKVVASTSGFIKIAPRSSTTTVTSPPSSTITTAKTPNGKIIYLQRSGGKTVPVRVPTSIASNSADNNQSKQTVAIHVIRTPEGNLVPFKSGKNINIPNSLMTGNKVVGSSGGGTSGHIVMKGPIKSVVQSGSRAIGSTIISSLEDRKPKGQQIIASKSVLTASSNGSGKVMVQNTPGTPRQIMVSGNMIKLSPNTSGGQLQAVQIPGKPGLQYVRVLNSSQAVTQKSASSESNATHKYTVVRQPNKQSIVVNSPMTEKERKIMTTVPTFRKINDVMVRTNDSGSGQGSVLKTQRISQINTQINKICGNASESRTDTSSNKYIVVPKSLIRNSVTSQNQKITQQRQSLKEASAAAAVDSPTKKLYSILRPTTVEHQQGFIMKAKVEPLTSKMRQESNALKLKQAQLSSSSTATSGRLSLTTTPRAASPPPSDDSSNVAIRRKHCNCTKSQCLKLYCDCFANGEFCQDCNCKDCLNNLENEDERQKAIRICLERNPNSFKPKITAATNESDQRLHNKGCNCKRSGCLKNYCECYEAKIPCSSNCKCIGCRNVEDHPDLDMDIKKSSIPPNNNLNNRPKRTYEDMIRPRASQIQHASSTPTASSVLPTTSVATACGPSAEKQPCNFITQEVVDATIQCLIAQADECEKSELTAYQTEKMIMEELGRCLVEIIDFSIRNTDQN